LPTSSKGTVLELAFNSTPSDPVGRTKIQLVNKKQPTLLIATGKDRDEGYRISRKKLAEYKELLSHQQQNHLTTYLKMVD